MAQMSNRLGEGEEDKARRGNSRGLIVVATLKP